MSDSNVRIILSAVDKNVKSTLDATAGNVQGFANRVDSAARLVAGFAAALGGSAVVGYVKNAIDAADQTGILASKLGLATEELSRLQYAAQLSDVSTEQMAVGLRFLARNAVEAAGGSKSAAADFKALGVSVTDSTGRLRGSEAILMDVADRFKAMENGALKTSLAMALFGKSGADLIPLLNAGGAGLRVMYAEAERFGLVVSEQAAAAANELNDNLDRLRAAEHGFANTLSGEALPVLNELARAMASNAGAGGEFARLLGGGLRVSLETLSILIANVGFVFKVLANDLGTGFAQIGNVVMLRFDEAKRLGDQAAAYARRERAELDAFEARILASRQAVAERGREDQAAAQKAAREAEERARRERAASTAAAAAKQEEARLTRLLADTDAARAKEYVANQARLDKALKDRLIGTYQYQQAVENLQKSITGYTDAEWALVEANHEAARMQAVLAEQGEAAAAAFDKAAEAADKYADKLWAAEMANSDSIEAAEALVRGLEEENRLLRLSGAERQKAVALRQLEAAGIHLAAEKLDEYRARLAAALAEGQHIQAMNDAVAAQASLWQDIERTAHDTFVSIFESGKDAFERLTDTLKNTLYDLLYQMTVKKWVISLAASISPAAATQAFGAQAAGAGGAGGFGMGSIFPALGLFGDYFATGAASTFFAGSGLFGGTGMALEAAMGLGGLEGLGMGIGAIAPWASAIAGIVALVDAFSTGGTPHLGTSREFDLSGGNRLMGRQELNGLPNWLAQEGADSPFNDAISGLGRTMVERLNADLAILGGELGADFALQFGFAAEREAETRSGGFARVMLGDETVFEIYDRYAKDGKKGIEQFTAEVMPRVELAALQMAEGMSPALDSLADSLDAARAPVEEVNALLAELREAGQSLALRESFADLNLSMGATDEAAIATGLALADLAGGFEALQAGLATYYQEFFSEEERAANLRQNISAEFARLGLAMPATREQFRALVESLDLTGEAGQEAFAVLMRLAPGFDRLADATEGVARAAEEAARQEEERLMGLEASYREAFWTDAERNAAAAAELRAAFTGLGVAMPDTAAGFRALVESVQAMGTEGRTLYEALLGLAPAFGSLVGKIRETGGAVAGFVQQVSVPSPGYRESSADAEVTKWVKRAGLLDEGMDTGAAMAFQVANIENRLATWIKNIEDWYAYGSGFVVVDQFYYRVKDTATNRLNKLKQDLARYTGLMTEHGPELADDLFELQNRFDALRASIGYMNADELARFNQAFQVAWQEILDGAVETVEDTVDEVARARERLGGWLDQSLFGQVSPLTAAQQLDAAQQQYVEQLLLAQGGDLGALEDITRYADQYLEASRAVFGGGGDFTAIWAGVREQIANLAQPSDDPATGAQLVALRDQVASLEDTLARLLEQGNSAGISQTRSLIEAITAAIGNLTRATEAGTLLQAHA